MVKVHTVLVSAFLQNCSIVACTETKEAVVIDPGYESEKIAKVINENNYTVVGYFITHAHVDHVSSITAMVKLFPAPVYMNPKEKPVLEMLPAWQKKYRFNKGTLPTNFKDIHDKDVISFGKSSVLAIATPGHTPGGTCFLIENNLFTGDTLFERNVGRTDFDFGDSDLLVKSIRENLFTLNEDTIIYPGHGAVTTIKNEKYNNPYCGLQI